MYLDSLLKLSDGQDLSIGTGAAYSSNAIDTGTTRDIGPGETLALFIVVDQAFTSASSTAKVKFSVIDDADNGLDSSSVIIVSTDAIIVTRLTLGKIIILPIPAGVITQQFIGMRVDVSVDTTDTGTVTAYIGPATFGQTWNA